MLKTMEEHAFLTKPGGAKWKKIATTSYNAWSIDMDYASLLTFKN